MTLPEAVPTVEIILDKPRKMALTLGALRRIQEQTGKSVNALDEVLQNDPLSHIGGLIWASLVNEDRAGLTRDDVEEMLHMGNLEAAVGSFHELLAVMAGPEGAEGKGRPVAKSEGKRPSASTSKPSGRLASSTSVSRTLNSGR